MSGNTVTMHSTNFPERSVLIHHRDPQLKLDKYIGNKYSSDNDCEMIFSSVDINGRGRYGDSKFHPNGLLYGVGDSLAQIQLDHAKGDSSNGFEYQFTPSLYSLYGLEFFDNKEAFFNTKDDKDFAIRLYQKRENHQVLVINNVTQAKLFHRFYRKSNMVGMKCSNKTPIKKEINKVSMLNERFNFSYSSDRERDVHREIRNEIEIPRTKTPNNMGEALLNSVIVNTKQFQPFYRLNIERNTNIGKTVFAKTKKPSFSKLFGYTYRTVSFNTDSNRFVDINNSEHNTKKFFVKVDANSSVLVNINGTFLYDTVRGEIQNIFSKNTRESSIPSSSGHNYKVFLQDDNVYKVETSQSPIVYKSIPNTWKSLLGFQNTSDYPQLINTDNISGELLNDSLVYNKQVELYISQIGNNDERLRDQFVQGINYEGDEIINKFKDIDDILWYVVVRDFAGVEFKVNHEDIKTEVDNDQLDWMRNVKSYFGVVWDTSVVETHNNIISNGNVNVTLNIERSIFTPHGGVIWTGWYDHISQTFLDIGGAGIKYALSLPISTIIAIKNNPKLSASLISAGFILLAGTGTISISPELMYSMAESMATLVNQGLNVTVAASQVITEYLSSIDVAGTYNFLYPYVGTLTKFLLDYWNYAAVSLATITIPKYRKEIASVGYTAAKETSEAILDVSSKIATTTAKATVKNISKRIPQNIGSGWIS